MLRPPTVNQSEQYAAAHYYLAHFYQDVGDIFEAIAHWEKVLSAEEAVFGVFSEDYCNTIRNLGVALTDKNILILGESFIRISLAMSNRKKYTDNGHYEFELARSLEENYRTGRLIGWFKKITAIAETDEYKGMAYHSLAVLHERVSGDFASAEECFKHALKHIKNSTNRKQFVYINTNFAIFLAEQNRIVEAEQHYRDALPVLLTLVKEMPDEFFSVLTLFYKELTKIALKKADDAGLLHWIGQWLTLAETSDNLAAGEILENIDSYLKQNGNIKKRYEILTKIANDYPSVQAKLLLAYCARDIGAVDEAKSLLSQIPPEDLSASDRKDLFFILLDQGDFSEAEREAELLNDPQLSLLLKTALLDQKESLFEQDLKGQLQSLLKEFYGLFEAEDDDDESVNDLRLLN